ncbi:uroporphyrin-III C/tetrapyrrole methyltransferase [Oscillochloris trichoides DG-6]|uniref:Ribosomal RNA small subunit methyltransferase I n=1 Tax=Oscillochloris trichoides DG-6 TaxID=765420 RepID=E1IAB7_9CHLR|nr:16S rRNA (cytidine(1402)-2'-O)-methyltransferase [Oscillochloris trichoides]EFO81871.1 uroporphyrin-III C/tetrapyrrole methyltransferase [Oscillochloris trichoides DG-6]
MGTLFLVATPIGNLEDITMRAIRVLREVRLIAAEDTRHTQRLLSHYQIPTACISYHEHNKLARLDAILAALAAGDVALVSDAGTPGVSDPGYELVCAAIAAGFSVTPVPGPSAPVAALTASGLPSDRFIFVGFLPRQGGERRALLSELAPLTVSLVCFEAPHRLIEALEDIQSTLGERQMVVAKDLTKRFEDLRRGSVGDLLAHFQANPPRGEYTLVIAGQNVKSEHKRERRRLSAPSSDEPPSHEAIADRLRHLRDAGQSGSAASRSVARELGLQKSVVYAIWLELE